MGAVHYGVPAIFVRPPQLARALPPGVLRKTWRALRFSGFGLQKTRDAIGAEAVPSRYEKSDEARAGLIEKIKANRDCQVISRIFRLLIAV